MGVVGCGWMWAGRPITGVAYSSSSSPAIWGLETKARKSFGCQEGEVEQRSGNPKVRTRRGRSASQEVTMWTALSRSSLQSRHFGEGGVGGAVAEGAEVDGVGEETGEGVRPPPGKLEGDGMGAEPPSIESTLAGGASRFCLRRKQWPVRNRTARPRIARG